MTEPLARTVRLEGLVRGVLVVPQSLDILSRPEVVKVETGVGRETVRMLVLVARMLPLLSQVMWPSPGVSVGLLAMLATTRVERERLEAT
jgi:hypothetical protein